MKTIKQLEAPSIAEISFGLLLNSRQISTENRGRFSNTPASYSAGSGFKPDSGDGLS
jgi:hypothetical protein